MGSLRALLVIASLSACGTSGLQVVVLAADEGAPPADQIRLFIGLPPDAAEAIAPEGFGPGEPRNGWVWVRDPETSADVLDVSPGDSVAFSFVSDADFTELGAIVAVGYTNGVPTSAGGLFHKKTGVGNVRVFELQLHPAVDPRVRANRTAELQVELWGANPGDETCVHLHNMRPDRDKVDPHDSVFIVAKDDQDCDGYPDADVRECAPAVHKATLPPRPDDLACATTIPDGQAIGSCVLGGPRCIDGGGTDPVACSPSRFCAPRSVCTMCQAATSAAALACIRDPLTHVSGMVSMTAIKCHVATQLNSMSTLTLCGDTVSATLPVPVRMPALQCGNAKITGPDQPLANRIQIGDMRIEVDVDSACTFELTASGDLSANVLAGTKVSGLATVDLDNLRSLALPLQIEIDPPGDCNNPGTCAIIGDAADRPDLCVGLPRPTTP